MRRIHNLGSPAGHTDLKAVDGKKSSVSGGKRELQSTKLSTMFSKYCNPPEMPSIAPMRDCESLSFTD